MTKFTPLSEPDAAQNGFVALVEELALDALSAPTDPERFQPLHEWLSATDPVLPLGQLAHGFNLSDGEIAAIAVLFALSTSEPVARAASVRIDAAGGVADAGLPSWALMHAVPGFGPADLAAEKALIRFGIVEAIGVPGPLIEARLMLSPAITDRLLGQPGIDDAVRARMLPITVMPNEGPLAMSLQRGLSARSAHGLPPVVLMPGASVMEVAAAVASLGLTPWLIQASDLPSDPQDRARLAAVWSRDAALDRAVLIMDTTAEGFSSSTITGFADRIVGQVVITGPTQIAPARGIFLIPPDGDTPERATERWAIAIGPGLTQKLGEGLKRIAAQFRLDRAGIDTAMARARAGMDKAVDAAQAEAALWHAAARAHGDPHLPGTRLVEPGYCWEDIVLSSPVEVALRRIETHVRYSTQVFDEWGFAARMGGRGNWRGRGVAVLFSGPPGTGKTMAAEILASELDLRVLMIDLSQIISKWIGETSKNIAAAFDVAEKSGAVMVWNEGDAIWGARGGVNSATDRHVNAEVGDLLQRIEEFSGFTIVTTNLRHAIDQAFLRRFRFAVDFPAPAMDERLRLWARAFPPETPVEPVNWKALADLPLTGGSIRNVALGAAFQAAASGGVVTRDMMVSELAAELKKHNLAVPRIDWAGAS